MVVFNVVVLGGGLHLLIWVESLALTTVVYQLEEWESRH